MGQDLCEALYVMGGGEKFLYAEKKFSPPPTPRQKKNKIRARDYKKNQSTQAKNIEKNDRTRWKWTTPPPPITFLMVRPLDKKVIGSSCNFQ